MGVKSRLGIRAAHPRPARGRPRRPGAAASAARKPRTLVALLAARAPDEPVAADRLIDALWPRVRRRRARPRAAGLRLPAAEGARRPGGDRAARRAATCCARPRRARLRRASRRSRARAATRSPPAIPRRPRRCSREALALWRGPALADLADERVRAAADAPARGAAARRARGRARRRPRARPPRASSSPSSRRSCRAAAARAAARRADARAVPRRPPGRRARCLPAARAHAGRRARRSSPGPSCRSSQRGDPRARTPSLRVEPPERRARAADLPAPATPLVGRRARARRADGAAAQPDVRLVTLTGPGGDGKTASRSQAARALRRTSRDGVVLRRRSPRSRDADARADAIASALGVERAAERAPTRSTRTCASGSCCSCSTTSSTSLDAAPVVVRAARGRAARSTVLVTSRAPLRLYGEHEFAVAAARRAPTAVDLFVGARARRRAPELGAEDAAAVERSARRLDGLPLAIELAAARTRTLAPAEMAAGPANRATGGPRDLPERQRTLRATLDWSHELLPRRERELFARPRRVRRRLRPQAAPARLRGGPRGARPRWPTRACSRTPAGRFRLLETVRRVRARALLADVTRARHAEHFAALAEEAEPQLTADRPDAGCNAWRPSTRTYARPWRGVPGRARSGSSCASSPASRASGCCAGTCARAAAGSTARWRVTSRSRPTCARRHCSAPPRPRSGRATTPPWTRTAARRWTLCEELDDRRGMAQALDRLGTSAATPATTAAAWSSTSAAWRCAVELGDVRMLAVSTTNIGCLAMMEGDYEHAEELSREGLALHEQAGRRDGMQQPMFNLGAIALLTGRRRRGAGVVRARRRALARARLPVGDRRMRGGAGRGPRSPWRRRAAPPSCSAPRTPRASDREFSWSRSSRSCTTARSPPRASCSATRSSRPRSPRDELASG